MTQVPVGKGTLEELAHQMTLVPFMRGGEVFFLGRMREEDGSLRPRREATS